MVTALYEHSIRYRAATKGSGFSRLLRTCRAACLGLGRFALRPVRPLAALEVRRRLGGSKCRCRLGKLPTPMDAGACPGSGLPTTDPQCTSAARGAAAAHRSCDPPMSSPECNG